MSHCIDQDFPCKNHDYSEFDLVARSELFDPPTMDYIVNQPSFCTFIPTDETIRLEELYLKDYLTGLKNKKGLYNLWIDYDNCDEHETHTMLCVYVGKGMAEGRILNHIKKKWPQSEYLYVTFYECSNRISKYLEQLFLDIYQFHLNKNENLGDKNLFAIWSNDLHLNGTESGVISEILDKKLLKAF